MENEMEGQVQEVIEKPTKNTGTPRFSIKVGGKSYSGFGHAPCKKGDIVHFEYSVNGQWNNIVQDSLEIVEDFEPPVEEQNEQIHRQEQREKADKYMSDLNEANRIRELRDRRNSCLMRALEFHKGEAGLTKEKIVETAKYFEKEYIYAEKE